MHVPRRHRLAWFALAVLSLAAALPSHGQGTVYFANRAPEVGLNQPVFDAGGFLYATGPWFVAQLLAGPTSSTLVPISPTVGLADPGYFKSAVLELPGILPGSATFAQVRIWSTIKGSTYAEAEAAGGRRGTSDLFTLVPGGDTRGGTLPPSLPGYMSNFKSFLVVGIDPPVVPEPTTTALALTGVAVFLGRKRSRL